jgi:hypothetical protein
VKRQASKSSLPAWWKARRAKVVSDATKNGWIEGQRHTLLDRIGNAGIAGVK